MSNPDQSPAGPEHARLLAEQVLAMDMVTDRGLKAREMARAVLESGHESPAELALRSLASWLGVGGYNSLTIDAKVMENRIRDGISAERSSEAAAMAATVPAGWKQIVTDTIGFDFAKDELQTVNEEDLRHLAVAFGAQAPVAGQPAEPSPASIDVEPALEMLELFAAKFRAALGYPPCEYRTKVLAQAYAVQNALERYIRAIGDFGVAPQGR